MYVLLMWKQVSNKINIIHMFLPTWKTIANYIVSLIVSMIRYTDFRIKYFNVIIFFLMMKI